MRAGAEGQVGGWVAQTMVGGSGAGPAAPCPASYASSRVPATFGTPQLAQRFRTSTRMERAETARRRDWRRLLIQTAPREVQWAGRDRAMRRLSCRDARINNVEGCTQCDPASCRATAPATAWPPAPTKCRTIDCTERGSVWRSACTWLHPASARGGAPQRGRRMHRRRASLGKGLRMDACCGAVLGAWRADGARRKRDTACIRSGQRCWLSCCCGSAEQRCGRKRLPHRPGCVEEGCQGAEARRWRVSRRTACGAHRRRR
jgi:hypothetical protein